MNSLYLKNDVSLAARHKPFPYQKEAFDAVRNLEYCGIFHEQGLGKTKIAIDLMLYWLSDGILDSVIIVVKKGLITNWKNELAAHTSIKPKLISQSRKENFFAFNSPSRLYLTHFEVFKSENSRLKLFLKTRRVGVIIDEAQKLKNPDSVLTKAFFELSSLFVRKAIMTGTPVANRPFDLWSLIYFLDEGEALGQDFKAFRSQYDFGRELKENPDAREAFENRLASLHGKLSAFTVRETKARADISLPDKEFHSVECEWAPIQFEMYSKMRDEFRLVLFKNGELRADDAEGILKRLLRLVQISSNPEMIDSIYDETPGKFPVLETLAEEIVATGEKAIVWTSFTENADWLTRELRARWGTVKVHGKMAMKDRDRSVEKFLTDPETKILVATPGAAKEGLTLTVANHVIFYDRSFSLDDYLQAQDRIHRISQTKRCHVYNLMMKDSVDEWVDVLIQEKQLAAQLASGDISKEKYTIEATYSMHEILESVLESSK